jgi:hypothetical protein
MDMNPTVISRDIAAKLLAKQGVQDVEAALQQLESGASGRVIAPEDTWIKFSGGRFYHNGMNGHKQTAMQSC